MHFEVPDEDYLHSALTELIKEAYARHDLRRCKVLWKCYDVMFSRPILDWDLDWRRRWGYPG